MTNIFQFEDFFVSESKRLPEDIKTPFFYAVFFFRCKIILPEILPNVIIFFLNFGFAHKVLKKETETTNHTKEREKELKI